jgi:hypothetical protein
VVDLSTVATSAKDGVVIRWNRTGQEKPTFCEASNELLAGQVRGFPNVVSVLRVVTVKIIPMGRVASPNVLSDDDDTTGRDTLSKVAKPLRRVRHLDMMQHLIERDDVVKRGGVTQEEPGVEGA